jgi:tripeptidyl-peptidase-1
MTLEFFAKHAEGAAASLHEELMEISTPKSGRYGEWMSAAEVDAIMVPVSGAAEAVVELAAAYNGTATVNRRADIVSVTASVAAFEDMLDIELFEFTHNMKQGTAVRSGSAYTLPASLQDKVNVVGELYRLPSLSQKMMYNQVADEEATDAWSSCGTRYSGYTNPAVLSERYSMTIGVDNVAAGNSMAVAEWQLQEFDDDDFEAFAAACGTPQVVVDDYNSNNPNTCSIGLQPCVESLLDLEYLGTMSAGVPLYVYYASSFSILDWLNEVISEGDDAAIVWSVSYGNDEVQQESEAYIQSVNEALMSVAAQGITIMFASGDQGVWGRTGRGSTFHPDFPAGSPYVTAVGGTDFVSSGVIGEETTWSGGGGGFSDEFEIPDYQATQVANYLAAAAADGTLPDSSLFNAEGRAYPDISALAGQVNPYFISYKQGNLAAVAGTSAACPAMAAGLVQVNNALLAAGKPQLGFVNPFIYSDELASGFNDVTSGDNNGDIAGTTGFTAIEGFDPATGMGTPKFDVWTEVALSL